MASNSLKDRISFIGIGQCGGNIASVASELGYKTGAINTSEEDLNSDRLKSIPHKMVIGTVGGCAKERKLGQKIVKEEYQSIIDFIGDKFLLNSTEYAKKGLNYIVYICFSTSGGTGSGVSPILISVLKKVYPEVSFNAIAVTPSDDESLIALNNSLKCMEELYKLNIPILIADNNNASKKDSRFTIYQSVNNEVIMGLNRFIKARESSNIANMDDKDKAKLLMTPGLSILTTVPLVDSDVETKDALSITIETSFHNNTYAKVNFDKKIKNAGFIFEIPEKVTKLIDYNKILANVGTPLEIFEGIYEADKKDNIIGMVTIILAGLNFPESKIKELRAVLTSKGDNVKSVNNTKKNLFDNDTDFDSLFKDDSDVDSLFSDFDTSDKSTSKSDEIDIESLFDGFN